MRGDTPIDPLDTIQEQARTAGYAFGMIRRGIEMGLAAQPLFPVLWEERMEQNLEELRAELGNGKSAPGIAVNPCCADSASSAQRLRCRCGNRAPGRHPTSGKFRNRE